MVGQSRMIAGGRSQPELRVSSEALEISATRRATRSPSPAISAQVWPA